MLQWSSKPYLEVEATVFTGVGTGAGGHVSQWCCSDCGTMGVVGYANVPGNCAKPFRGSWRVLNAAHCTTLLFDAMSSVLQTRSEL